jgi:MoaA/NifB/PqqE/SkfB family radical SAM enzyme
MFIYTDKTEQLFGLYCRVPHFVRAMGARLLNTVRHTKRITANLPDRVIFFVTDKCNANCGHCRYRQCLNRGDELSLDAIEKILVSLGRGLSNIVLTGGEPFLRKDLDKICLAAYRCNRIAVIDIFTNGLISEDTSIVSGAILQKVPATLRVWVSLEGLDHTHDMIRGIPGAFQEAMNTIEYLKQLKQHNDNIQVFIITTISLANFEDIEPLIRFVKQLHIRHVLHFIRHGTHDVYNLTPTHIFKHLSPQDKRFALPSLPILSELNKKIERLLAEDDVYVFFNKVESLRRKYTLEILQNKQRLFSCIAGTTNALIYPNGEVALCPYSSAVGNVCEFDYNFCHLWNSSAVAAMRLKLSNCACTEPCYLLSSMSYDSETLLTLSKC